MSEENVPNNKSGGNVLTVSPIEGEARILDTDLGKRLGFDRPRKIRDIIRRYLPDMERMGPCPMVGRVINGGEATEFYLNRKQAIFITAKSDTPNATDITIEIIQKFDAYERGLIGNAPARDPMDILRDPNAMRTLLLSYSEKVIALEGLVGTQAPKVDAFDRIANSDGMMNLTNAAKTLQVPPRKLTTWLIANRWIYRRPGGRLAAFQSRIVSGDLTHKTGTIELPDGTDKDVWHVQVTAKGLAKLALVFRSGELDFAAAE